MHQKLILFLFIILPLSAFAQQKTSIYHDGWIDFNKNGTMDIFEDPLQPVEKRISDLLSQMTVEEKTMQMVTLYGYSRVLPDELPTKGWDTCIWKDGIANIDEHLNGLAYHSRAKTEYSYPFHKHAEAINTVQHWFVENTRLGIPVDFSNEGIHGLNHDRATSLPAPIGTGSTWDKALVRKAGNIVGREARALGYTNVYAPILDLARDPRWGRTVECYSEDPFLIAELGKQMTLGIQETGTASTLKHYAVYSMPKGGRDGTDRTDPHVAPREMYQMYLYPFRRVVEEAHVMGVMSSYNDWNGVPVTGSYYFLTELLRQKFGFTGYIVSDSDAVKFIYSKHHVAGTYKDAVRQAVEAGLNVRTTFTPPAVYVKPLRELVKEGSISMETIDRRVADVLRVKFELGLFDRPYVAHPEEADKLVNNQEAKEFSKKINLESMVLLKNAENLLPLDRKKIRSILVTGPLAAEKTHSISRYGPSNLDVISVLEGIQKTAGKNITVNYAKGCEVIDDNWPESELFPDTLTTVEKQGLAEAVNMAGQSDVIIAVMGETEKIVGESKSRTSLNLPGRQLDLLRSLYATGKPVILVLINGRPLTINWADKYIPAILEAWFPGESGGEAVAKTLFGEYNPGGKLPVTFPKTVGQLEYNFPFKPGSQARQSTSSSFPHHTRLDGVLYPFGYGLSYTSFAFSNLEISPETQGPEGSLTVSCDI
ncbi:MAG TPA: glycoside hydrolase family 3 N-terminal domain-containing protein, partial [Bacteroidales bacterium]|nr:glycoside hydrolase family 3 N-terminal domain-containing protein [Bacteroidales bacterium]